LRLAQLRNQDPMAPLENGEFLGQMAQFSTVEGIQDLGEAFNDLAGMLQSNRALQASSLVGRSVMVPGDTAELRPGEAIKGAVELPATATSVTVTILDSSGQTVRSFDLGAQTGGTASFSWDGLSNAGQPMPAGTYQVRVEAMIDGEISAMPTSISSKVESVSLGQGGTQDITLNVAGVGPVPLADVNEIL
ncbi:MAG: flagellar hook assembly protein FlgD, partial [Gammaproteobacteria bacterium]|nr:flagellar hook assembly protein FlgD [Gammaproteobacteria bacterium]